MNDVMINTISEADMKDYVVNKAIKRMDFVQEPDGKYRIVVTLTWKPGQWVLVNARKRPRYWVSLDRLVRHIQSEYGGEPPPINLVLLGTKEMVKNE